MQKVRAAHSVGICQAGYLPKKRRGDGIEISRIAKRKNIIYNNEEKKIQNNSKKIAETH